MDEFYVLRDRRSGLYLRFDEYGCLSPVNIKTDASSFTRANAEVLIDTGVHVYDCDSWPYAGEHLDLECVYVAEWNVAQLWLRL